MLNKFLPVLIFCAIFFLPFAGVYAQSNVEYNFRQQSTAVGSSYGFPANFEEAPNLTMSCLAANGYGQWTLSSSAGSGGSGEYTGATRYPGGWYLLANGLYTPSTNYESGDPTDYPGCYPPGVVQDSALTFPTEVKAVTNLSGMAGFIWPEQVARQSFVLNGFTAADFNLSLSFLTNPSPVLALGTGNTDIVTHTIHSWPSVSTSVGLVTHAITSASGDWRDNFDVCSDAYYNYFIWASSDHPVYTGQTEVWVMAVPIGSSTPAFGPTMVDDLVHHDGQLPTITCDPRNNRSGTPAPAFDLAYIQLSTNNIMTASYSGVLSTPVALTKTFWDPNVGSPGSALPWGLAYHARIVRNSVYGGTSSVGIYATVNRDVLAHHASGILLAYYAPGSLGGPAAYVAGDLRAPPTPITFTGNPPVKDGPIIAFADPYDNQANWHETDETHCLYQYDLGPTALPSEFPLCIVRGCDVTADWPDLYSAFTPDASTQDTRLVLNQSGGSLENDPTANWYVGAVNQMGIHVHWLAPSGMPSLVTHFYARDQNRTFDETIDENTLVTDICTVSDGSSTGTNHGGTVGAELIDNKSMAIWTDPNYGSDFSDHTGDIGLWQPGSVYPVGGYLDPHVGTLDFVADNTILQIGGMGSGDGGADLSDMPYFYCSFDPESTGQGITVGPSSTFDYYGLIANHNSDGTIKNGSTLFPDIGSPFVYFYTNIIEGAGIITLHGYYAFDDAPPYSTYKPANLKIHGGSDFGIGAGGELQSVYYGNIQVLYDGNVYPIPPAAPRHLTGHATLHGVSYIEESNLEGNIPADSAATIISIRGYVASLAIPQFISGSTTYSNNNTHGASEIQIQPELKPCNAVEFDTDNFEAARIHDIDPETIDPFPAGGPGELTIDNSAFNYMHGRSIFVEDNEDPTGGDAAIITINNNYFGYIDTHDRNTDPDAAAFGTYGIYIKGLDANFDGSEPGLVGTVIVQDNSFPSNSWSRVNPSYPTVSNLEYAAAICFENTTGNIIGNRILDPGYTNGIWLLANPYEDVFPPSLTYVCSNTIENLYPQAGGTSPAPELLTGMITENHFGLIKLNTITNCEVGLLATGLGHNYLAYNSIDDYYATYPHAYDIEQAIQVTSPSATNYLDLSGQHGATSAPPDNGAFNMITATYDDWSIGMITIGSNSQLILDNEYQGFTWTQYAQNNMYLANPSFPSPSTSTQPTAADAYILKGLGGSPALFPGLDFNFWGIDAGGNKIDPLNEGGPLAPHEWNAAAGSGQQNAANISITTLPSNTLGSESTFSGVACLTSEYEGTKHKGAKPLSNDSVPTGCQLAFNLGMAYESNGQYAISYDSLKNFVQTCPMNPNAPGAFGIMSSDVAEGGNGTSPGCWIDYRNWLLSALAWNPGSPSYFCADVQALVGALRNDPDTSWQQINTGTNQSLSVLYWINHNPICANAFDSQAYINGRGSQIRTWLDTQDTSTTPLDTTIYTMQQLGLDSVLKYAGLLGVSNNTPSIISNATAYPNPTGEGTVISFGIAREAYVAINLYDVLGHQVSSSGFGGVVEPGNLSVPISLVGLPSGTYFARIQTTYGEAQTVKLVKE